MPTDGAWWVAALRSSTRVLRRRDTALTHRDGFLALLRWLRLRNQPLHLRNARAAIGAGFQPRADLGGCVCAGRDRVANCGAADAETGADHGPGAGKSVGRFA